MLHRPHSRRDSQRRIALIPPPVAPPDRDRDPLQPLHERLLAQRAERRLQPEHLREQVQLAHLRALPARHPREVEALVAVAERVALRPRRPVGVPEHVLLARGRQVVRLLVDPAAGEEQGHGDGALAGVPGPRERRARRVLGCGVGSGVFGEGVREDLVADLGGDAPVVKGRGELRVCVEGALVGGGRSKLAWSWGRVTAALGRDDGCERCSA